MLPAGFARGHIPLAVGPAAIVKKYFTLFRVKETQLAVQTLFIAPENASHEPLRLPHVLPYGAGVYGNT